MAKQAKKQAKRVFFVRRNIDDISAFRNTTTDPQKLLDFYEGEFFGSAGAEEDVCSGRSVAFLRGWEIGSEGYRDAADMFEKAREAGRKSAESREAKQGSAQPQGGKGHGTKNRTSYRTQNGTTFGKSEQESERPSDVWGHGDVDSTESTETGFGWGRTSEQESERPSDPSEQESEPSSIQHPAARNEYGSLKMTSGMSARARTNGEQQDENEERPKFREVHFPGFVSRERVHA